MTEPTTTELAVTDVWSGSDIDTALYVVENLPGYMAHGAPELAGLARVLAARVRELETKTDHRTSLRDEATGELLDIVKGRVIHADRFEYAGVAYSVGTVRHESTNGSTATLRRI